MTLTGGSAKRLDYNAGDLPLISVITVVKNGEDSLARTIKSVANQTYPALQYIVIDGDSSDGSLEILRAYDTAIDYWLSEPDQGIADAMNKGLSFAHGDYVVFIHADDHLPQFDCLSRAAACLDDQHDVFAFDVLFGERRLLTHPRGANFWINFKMPVCHQGILMTTKLFQTHGHFDTSFRICMDYELLLRAYRQKLRIKICPMLLAEVGDKGLSSQTDLSGLNNRLKEEHRAQLKHAEHAWMTWVYAVYWLLYKPYKLGTASLARSRP